MADIIPLPPTQTGISAPLYYILENGEPVGTSDLMRWARFMESEERIIKKSQFGRVEVSTVFLGLDHNLFGDGPPLLYESMIFGGEHDLTQRRYYKLTQALKGHQELCELVTDGAG